jgi:hypothetical protein
MNWWREQWRKDDPFGIPYVVFLIGIYVAPTVVPLVVVAVGMSFLMPVERWFAVLAVLMGWAIQWRLFPVVDGAAIPIGVATAWIFGAYVSAFLLGPVPALVVIIVASDITIWAIGRGQARAEAADDAAADARLEEDLGTPQERFDDGHRRMRLRMVGLWHVDEAEVDRLLDEWDAEAAVRGPGRFDRRYWHAGSDWLREKVGVSDDVW